MVTFQKAQYNIFTLIVLISISLVLQNAEALIHQNNQYGFQIEFPDNWYIDDQIVNLTPIDGINSGSSLLANIRDGINWWEHKTTVTLTTDDYFVINFSDEEYIKEIENTLEQACMIANFEVEGYRCSNYLVIDSKITEIYGTKAYQVKESWTETYSDNSTSDLISILTDIIVEDDVWTIHSVNNAMMYSNNTETIDEIINSFKFIEKTEQEEHPHEEDVISEQLPTPLKQFKSGILVDEIQCKQNLILLIKNNGSPACVSLKTAEKLEEREWGTRA